MDVFLCVAFDACDVTATSDKWYVPCWLFMKTLNMGGVWLISWSWSTVKY